LVDKIVADESIGMLPLKGNWRYRPYDISQFTLPAGDERIILDLRRKGWVVAGFVFHSNQNMNLAIELETGTENYINTFSTYELYNLGVVQSQATGWWVSRYDTLSNVYNVMFSPAAWLPFYKRCKVTLQNKTALPAIVYRVGVLCIEFVTEEEATK